RLHVTATHGRDPGAAEGLLAAVGREVVPATAFVGRFSPVMTVHTGVDIVALAWWWERQQ
ncbi:MAG: hypothetical protein ACRDZY_06670, partial [Acidimicrobiales bacterium]